VSRPRCCHPFVATHTPLTGDAAHNTAFSPPAKQPEQDCRVNCAAASKPTRSPRADAARSKPKTLRRTCCGLSCPPFTVDDLQRNAHQAK
jgi:hypothetical protein